MLLGDLLKLDLEVEHITSTHILVIRPYLVVREPGKCRLSAMEKNVDFCEQIAISEMNKQTLIVA